MLLKETIKSLEGWKFCSQSSCYFGIYFPDITVEGSKHDDVFVPILLLVMLCRPRGIQSVGPLVRLSNPSTVALAAGKDNCRSK